MFHDHDNGFTLVELAIALMVIGLLIGGVLKGQELIDNARMTRVLRDIEGFKTATMIFQNTYGALPGDIKKPGSRLPNCSEAPCSTIGDGNGWIGPSVCIASCGVSASAIMGMENRRYWLHLAVANLISGVDASGTSTEGFGVNFPESPVGGGYVMVYSLDITPTSPYDTFHANALRMVSNLSATLFSYPVLTARQALQLDSKYDDGKPYKGHVLTSTSSTNPCVDASEEYNVSTDGIICSLQFNL